MTRAEFATLTTAAVLAVILIAEAAITIAGRSEPVDIAAIRDTMLALFVGLVGVQNITSTSTPEPAPTIPVPGTTP